jgi:hypothetical protein
LYVIEGDLDQALPLPAPRHFAKEYSALNRNLIYIELPRTGHTAAGIVMKAEKEMGVQTLYSHCSKMHQYFPQNQVFKSNR